MTNEKNIIYADLIKEKRDYFIDLANLETKYFKLYIYSNIQAYQQKRAAIRLKILDICEKIVEK